MDSTLSMEKKLTELLKGTIDPNQRREAEEQLAQIHKIIGFAPALLRIVMRSDLELPVRQAGAVYLKNLITQNWIQPEPECSTDAIPFSIHEQDRGMIRDMIVDALIVAPEIIRVQLALSINTLVKHDFPARWTQIVDKISIYLQNPDPVKIYGALISMHQLVKNFEYKKGADRAPLNEAMNMLLPMIHTLITRLMVDQSDVSVTLQKLILKIFFCLTQYYYPLELISNAVFSQWMTIILQVIDRPVPPETNNVDEEERDQLSWWKCKKWACHIVVRIFERYGSPGNVLKEYKAFAEWYLKTFTGATIGVLIKLLEKKRRNEYVAPRVLQETLNYLVQAVSHAHSWSFMKGSILGIIQEVLFPLMCHTNDDEEMWKNDPEEYIHIKFDVYEDLLSHVFAARNLLHTACAKRKKVLPAAAQFVIQILMTPNVEPFKKDGALHMIGSIADILFKKEVYKDKMEEMLFTYVLPELSSTHGFLRARACWTLNQFAEVKFTNEAILMDAKNRILTALLCEREQRVQIEAALALQTLLNNHEDIQSALLPDLRKIILELLKLIEETKNDDVASVLQKFVCIYNEDIAELSVEISQNLVSTFLNMLEGHEEGCVDDEFSLTAMSILSTIESLLNVFEEDKAAMAAVRPIILKVVVHILSKGIIDYYEEALTLVCQLTCLEIAPEMWEILGLIYEVFQKDGLDYFTDMMPALHNYVTVDTNAFLSNENHLLGMFNMCRTVLNSDTDEDPECHAAKLLEVIILQCKGRIDQCIPIFVECVLERLTREIRSSELRIMCLQVVIAALYYNPNLLLESLNMLQTKMASEVSIVGHFIGQWIHDTDCFLGLHDRKLCVIGLCTLMTLEQQRPVIVNEFAPKLIPSLIVLFQGLKRAYAARASEEEEDESDEEEEDSDIDIEALSSDEDEVDNSDENTSAANTTSNNTSSSATGQSSESNSFNMSNGLNESTSGSGYEDEDDEDEEYEPSEESAFEGYTTPLDVEDCLETDEFIIFKNVLLTLQMRDPDFYSALTSHLTPEQQKQILDIFTYAEQRRAAAESKRIEEAGGFSFNQHAVPSSFNFGGSPPVNK